MENRHSLFALVCPFLISALCFPGPLLVVADAAAGDDGGTAIMCRTGWNGNSETVIPESWVNDNYCDCPFDGRDEPDTGACSGSLSWAGVNTMNRYVTEIDCCNIFFS